MAAELPATSEVMTPHTNLKRALLVLGLSACICTLPAQTPQATPGQSTNPDRPSTKSESDTTDRSTRTKTNDPSRTGTPQATPGARAGDKTQATDTARSRTGGDASEMMVGPQDQKFLMETAEAGMAEVQLAQLAQQKATSNEVKEFAKQLEQDHSKANEELKTLAQQKNINLPSEAGAKHQNQISKFNNLSGDKFDKEYVKAMVSEHKKKVKEFQKQSDRSMDSNVKEFAAKTLPTLQTHLQKAEELQTTSTRARKADDNATKSSPDSSAAPDTRSTTPGARSTTPEPRSTTPDTQNKREDATQKPQGQNNPTPPRNF
jgi:putative membrane protein